MSLIIDAEVIEHEQVGPDFYRLKLLAPEILKNAVPGQFVHVRVSQSLEPLLRRPISIHNVNREKGQLMLLYQVVGRGTAVLTRAKPGQSLNLLGPLGRGFTLPAESQKVVVVAGGIGVAPLIYLLQELALNSISAAVYLGARSKEYLLAVKEISSLGFTPFLATDDGSEGYHGPVTSMLEKDLAKQPVDIVYSCGPFPMLKSLAKILMNYNIPFEVSLEERMGCGVGACLSCACKIKSAGEAGYVYRHVCVDGPVFSGQEVAWDEA
ncbi:dihydroorotate dehydrogenase electron transfer subunit [Desulfolucanica intricata]|uniref:dihydroorotate dehydrogenase electron transfer subunit n=1 Tax=Desulfolucanica intricata TaxID=1285191 RepID=UPI0008347ADF|nr:dihydroorotate dehydrogenase electron transfer subunit [Desulfolucanica intricata]